MLNKTLALIAGMAVSAPAFAADLSLTFQGALPANGPLMVAIHDSGQSFSGGGSDGAIAVAILPSGSAGLTLQGLAPGRYAVKAFQDTNGDRILNIGSEKRPIEPVAISGRQTGGWPDFTAAAIDVEESAKIVLTFGTP